MAEINGSIIETHAPEVAEEKEVLKLYNERLVRKLEEKIVQLELQVIERVEAEKAMKESEERFRALFEYAPDGYFLTDLKGTFIDGNRTAESLIGYNRADLIGKNYLELKLISPKQLFKAATLLEKNRRGQATGPDEFTLKRSDGGQVTVEIWTYPLKIKDKIWILGSARDISERLRAQESVARSEDKFSKAFQSSPEPMLITTLNEGRFLEVNRSFEKIFGYRRKKLIGRTVYDINLWGKPGDRDRLLLSLSDKGPVQNRSFAFRSNSGEMRHCLVSIDKIIIEGEKCLLSVIQDVTEKKRVEEQLQTYQENLKSLSSELTLAEERERRRLAVNLHDQISQPLAMAKIKLTGLPLKEIPESLSSEIEEAKSFLSAAIERSRVLTHELSPPILHEIGLPAAVRWRLDQIGQQTERIEPYPNTAQPERVGWPRADHGFHPFLAGHVPGGIRCREGGREVVIQADRLVGLTQVEGHSGKV